ncbi:MAG TPA: hypothetical protein VGI83_04640, partial [Gemmatimonadales bacterium]
FNVQAGQDYAVLGVCDQDCADIDLRVYDDNGTELGSDFEKDDHPVVRFTPRTARVKVHVYMATCNREPCFYGVGIFSRGGSANSAAVGPNSAGASTGGSSAERWLGTVRNELDRYGNQLLSGYGLQGTPTTGSIRSTNNEDIWVTLSPGVEYAILGVCDQDCSDIDLKLYDDADNEIGSDFEKDDHPIVRVTPIRQGRFKVHIYMATCAHDPCFYGVGVYQRGSGSANNASVGSGTATGAGAERWLRTVRAELDKYGPPLEQQGYVLQGNAYTGSLRKTSSEDLNITLEAGFDYAFLGVCDSDCGDIDLQLSDAGGQRIDSNYEKDDHPVVKGNQVAGGQYKVHVYMASCSTEPCYYGIGVYRRRGASGKGGESPDPTPLPAPERRGGILQGASPPRP